MRQGEGRGAAPRPRRALRLRPGRGGAGRAVGPQPRLGRRGRGARRPCSAVIGQVDVRPGEGGAPGRGPPATRPARRSPARTRWCASWGTSDTAERWDRPLDALKKAAQAVVGAPHVFNAARACGGSSPAAADVMAASAAAVQVAASHTDGTPGMQNAIRHFVWQAYLAGRHGTAVAEAVAAAHEEGRDTPSRHPGGPAQQRRRPGVRRRARRRDRAGSVRRARAAGRGRRGEVGGRRAGLGQRPLSSVAHGAPCPVATSANDVDSGDRPIRRPPGSR